MLKRLLLFMSIALLSRAAEYPEAEISNGQVVER